MSAKITADTVREWGRRYSNWGRWGPDDELGALNFITPERILAATALPRRGQVISCGLNFDQKGPQSGAGPSCSRPMPPPPPAPPRSPLQPPPSLATHGFELVSPRPRLTPLPASRPPRKCATNNCCEWFSTQAAPHLAASRRRPPTGPTTDDGNEDE